MQGKSAFARIRLQVLVASLLAWGAIVAPALWSSQAPAAFMCSSGWLPGATGDWIRSASVASLLMIAAMMLPLAVQPLWHIRISSFSDRQGRSAALFLLGYAALWLGACLALKSIGAVLMQGLQDEQVLALIAVLSAGLWQISPLKQRCLNRCHSYPSLAAFGWRADLGALRFGVHYGTWCLGSCWALMLFADWLSQWQLAGMILATVIMFCERMDPPARPSWRLRGCRMASLRLRHMLARHYHGIIR